MKRPIPILGLVLGYLLVTYVLDPMVFDNNLIDTEAPHGAAEAEHGDNDNRRFARGYSVYEATLVDGLNQRAHSAAVFAMQQLQASEGYENTRVSVTRCDVVGKPNNLTTPYVGDVVLSITDERLDFEGSLSIAFGVENNRWYAGEIRAGSYAVGPRGRIAPRERLATIEVLESIISHHKTCLYAWKLAYTLDKLPDVQPSEMPSRRR